MAIDYSSVITKEELELLSVEEYQNIKLICEAKNKTDQGIAYYRGGPNDHRLSKSYEFAFKNENFAEKQYYTKILITANLLYFNNASIIKILISKNITYKILSTTVNRINSIKSLIQNGYELDKHTTISDKNLNTICKLIRKYYPYDDNNLIIAKLVEIVVFDKELYLSLEGGAQKIYTGKSTTY